MFLLFILSSKAFAFSAVEALSAVAIQQTAQGAAVVEAQRIKHSAEAAKQAIEKNQRANEERYREQQRILNEMAGR